ncbi:hypothetical protein ACQRC6_08225 [Peptoniphilus sp. SGI.035]|uniref:hypothetical protein n=1 Tax=Peptoniphilus sp. SGI.035 TaxID=3420564 RepID=UPI003D034529
MAEIKIILDKEEQKEKEELERSIESLDRDLKLKFKGFLEGLNFIGAGKNEN